MASYSLCLVSIALIVLAVSQTCRSNECTGENIGKCEIGNYENDCPYYRKIVKCLEELDECTQDDLKLEVEQLLTMYRNGINHCPGLPDGECFFLKIEPCEENVPYDVVYRSFLPEADKKEACDAFKGKSEKSKQCMAAIRPLCPTESYWRSINSSIHTVERIEKACGFTVDE